MPGARLQIGVAVREAGGGEAEIELAVSGSEVPEAGGAKAALGEVAVLLEHVREGFTRLDRGEIDAFELDELIHRYKRSARELWKFCGHTGSDWEHSARTLEWLREEGEEPDWCQAGETPRRRS